MSEENQESHQATLMQEQGQTVPSKSTRTVWFELEYQTFEEFHRKFIETMSEEMRKAGLPSGEEFGGVVSAMRSKITASLSASSLEHPEYHVLAGAAFAVMNEYDFITKEREHFKAQAQQSMALLKELALHMSNLTNALETFKLPEFAEALSLAERMTANV